MPNHIITKIQFEGNQEHIDKFFEAIREDIEVTLIFQRKLTFIKKSSDELPADMFLPENPEDYEVIDFNKIIPMPLYIPEGGLGSAARERLGEDNWYDWRLANWGTKWNAYSTSRDGNEIYMQTAWSAPMPIIVAIARYIYNHELEISFEGKYADEDMASNTGFFFFEHGEDRQSIHHEHYPSHSQEGFATYLELWGETEDIIQDESGNYSFKEEDDEE